MFTIEATLEATVILGCTPHGERRFVNHYRWNCEGAKIERPYHAWRR